MSGKMIDMVMRKITILSLIGPARETEKETEDSFRFTNVNDENDVRIAEQYLVS